MTVEKLAPQIDAASQACERLALARDEARRETLVAVREVEAALTKALAGDVLRLPNILPDGYPKLTVVGVRGGRPASAVLTGRHVLVLGERGRLEVVHLACGELARRPALDDDLVAQDLALVVEALRCALDLHVRRADRSSASYGAALALARKVRGAHLGG